MRIKNFGRRFNKFKKITSKDVCTTIYTGKNTRSRNFERNLKTTTTGRKNTEKISILVDPNKLFNSIPTPNCRQEYVRPRAKNGKL